MAKNRSLKEQTRQIKLEALGFPETHEDHPWGETVVKVRKKVFLFLGSSDTALSFSVKLPETHTFALMMSNVAPTGYGLGKSGWVTASFSKGESAPMDVVKEWIEESYRAVAPKTLVKKLDAQSAAPSETQPKPARNMPRNTKKSKK